MNTDPLFWKIQRCGKGARALSVLGLLAAAPAAWAQAAPPDEGEEWSVSGRLEGEEDERAEDVSGIACSSLPPRDCLVIDDETQSAQWVTVEPGRLIAGESIRLIDDMSEEGEPIELDGEAAAFGDGSFFVIGSFGSARRPNGGADNARIEAGSRVFQITPTPGEPLIDESGALRDLILADPDLKPFADQPLADNGLTVEGLAVIGETSFVGFRGPLLEGEERAAVLQLPTAMLFGAGDGEATMRRLPLGSGRGVRDLSVVGEELLVLAGPMRDTDEGDAAPDAYSVYRWDPSLPDPDSTDEMQPVLHVPGFRHGSDDTRDKPEAIAPLDLDQGMLTALILFDGPKEGAPRSFSFNWPE